MALIAFVLGLYDSHQCYNEIHKDDSNSQVSYVTSMAYKLLILFCSSLAVYFTVKFIEYYLFAVPLPRETNEKPSTRLSCTTAVWGDQHNEVDALGVGAHEASGYDLDDEIPDIQNANIALLPEIAVVQNASSGVGNEIPEVKSASDDLSGEISEVQSASSDLRNEISEVESANGDLTDEIPEVESASSLSYETQKVEIASSDLSKDIPEVESVFSDLSRETPEELGVAIGLGNEILHEDNASRLSVEESASDDDDKICLKNEVITAHILLFIN